uniref:Protein kinase domain-containing protein n=1 Tax=Physcomitrium patens TaxID=3218 RepID=A0A7I4E7T7_PHYPA
MTNNLVMATSFLGLQALWCNVILLLLSQDIALAQTLPEAQILIAFRNSLVDEKNALLNWQESSTSPCTWTGVSCTSDGYVTGVDLSSMNLKGGEELHIPLCHLPNLISLQLQENCFSGPLPSELSNCTNLEHLNLGANNFGGAVPAQIMSSLPKLKYLNLSMNNFTGALPDAVGNLRNLQSLDLIAMGLSEGLPAELGQLVEIQHLALSWNSFAPEFTLPDTIMHLQRLRWFECAGCGISGALPTWLGELQNLEYLDLSNNLLTGAIPASLMSLQNLQWLELYKNKITGQIPLGIWNLTSLTDLDVSDNLLTGAIPDGIARLENLAVLHLQNNCFEGPMPSSIANLTKLYDVKLYMNKLNGTIPSTLGRNSPLLQFDVSNNQFHGNVPESYGNCSSLIRIRMFGNHLSGGLPDALWGLVNLNLLEIYDNELEGNIPAAIANATNLSSLKINNNRFTGRLPPELGHLKKIERFHAHHNNFSGEIPSEIGNLGSSLTDLYLDANSLSGEVPTQIGNLINLVYLGLSSNRLTGPLPPVITNLENLIFLDVSHNFLSGDLSSTISNLNIDRFVTFNCSYNRFSGRFAARSIDLLSLDWFIGNPDICMAGSNCHEMDAHHSTQTLKKSVIVSVVSIAAVFSLAALILIALTNKCFGKGPRNVAKLDSYSSERQPFAPWSITLFHQVSITYKELMECLDEENVIGSGGGGEVYKATLRSGQEIAIKKLWEAGKGMDLHENGFKAEVDTLGTIRHRNIVKLLCCCSSFTTNFLVYEYMPNGSLGEFLHGASKDSTLSDWSVRYKIAVGAAQGLAYLHHDCVPQILHRDIKSNNILLDDEYEARIADFGLAKGLDDDASMSVVAGSYGYIAPEYAYTLNVDEKTDVYSFGVVLMELITGRRPVAAEFGDAMDIVRWVSKQRREHGDSVVVELLDQRIAALSSFQAQMMSVFNIAVVCTQILPKERPTMRQVADMLIDAQKSETETY